jgi:hypothetical protein
MRAVVAAAAAAAAARFACARVQEKGKILYNQWFLNLLYFLVHMLLSVSVNYQQHQISCARAGCCYHIFTHRQPSYCGCGGGFWGPSSDASCQLECSLTFPAGTRPCDYHTNPPNHQEGSETIVTTPSACMTGCLFQVTSQTILCIVSPRLLPDSTLHAFVTNMLFALHDASSLCEMPRVLAQ